MASGFQEVSSVLFGIIRISFMNIRNEIGDFKVERCARRSQSHRKMEYINYFTVRLKVRREKEGLQRRN